MATQFKFSNGELKGVVTLILLIVAVFLFILFYDGKDLTACDSNVYKCEVEAFLAEQKRLDDSVQIVRQQRRSDYKSRDYFSQNRRNQYSVCESGDSSFKHLVKKETYKIVKVDLNSCDTNDLLTIPQFGSKRAAKLVEYRQKLGGFYDFAQVINEIFIFQTMSREHLEKYCYIDKTKISKIRINTASYRDLIAHPYFDAYLAKKTISHREKNGKIHSMAEFQKLTNAYDELIEKLTPYVDFN
ncbi:MAG: helix-hairpin-helix domain-containing protein [Bacteroidales bacterium]|nr:helix-hairpin-helix domain-containing protein [Bacteroidales bacterium]